MMDPTAAMEAFREILRVRRLLDERGGLDAETRGAVLALVHAYADLVDQHATVMRAFKTPSSPSIPVVRMPGQRSPSTTLPAVQESSNGNGAHPGEYRFVASEGT